MAGVEGVGAVNGLDRGCRYSEVLLLLAAAEVEDDDGAEKAEVEAEDGEEEFDEDVCGSVLGERGFTLVKWQFLFLLCT